MIYLMDFILISPQFHCIGMVCNKSSSRKVIPYCRVLEGSTAFDTENEL